MMKKLLKVNDISSMIHASRKTIYQWAELGQIPCIKLNGCLRFDPDEIIKWIEACRRGGDER